MNEETICIDDEGNIVRKRRLNILGGIVALGVILLVGPIIMQMMSRELR
jgi:hypothetical protein